MKHIQIIMIILALGLLAGCKAPRLTWDELQDRYDAHRHETMNSMLYMGSDLSDHYFFHSFLTMRRTVYRVSKSELPITDEFPVTKDKDLWREYEMPFSIEINRLENVKIVTNEQHLRPVSSEAAPSAPPDEPSR